jgi:hypothetical protein
MNAPVGSPRGLVATLLAVALGLGGCAEQRPSGSPGAAHLVKGDARVPPANDEADDGPVDGLRSRIRMEASAHLVGAPLLVWYTVENTGTEPATVWHSGFWPNHRITVLDQSGNPVPRTELGNRVDRAFAPGGLREKATPVAIQPGTLDDRWEPIDLTQYFRLNKPGKYTVQFRYEDAQSTPVGPVLSNVLAVDLTS